MNLAIDIGNTRTKAGVFKDGELLHTQHWPTGEAPDFFGLATNHGAKNIILSSVAVDLSVEALAKLSSRGHALVLQAATPIPIKNSYLSPETLGKDRLAAAIGAYALFPGQACLVVDAGSCLTYDFLDGQGNYLGGNIAPGIQMRLRAMHAFTARLPEVGAGPSEDWIGQDTAAALRNGAQQGAVLEIEGYRQRAQDRFGELRLLLTGGDASYLATQLKSELFVNEHLVLIGLNKILEHNVN